MTDAVDADELLRRIQRARAWAQQEEQHWKTQSDKSEKEDPNEALGAEIFACAYEAVRKVLDEVIEPGINDRDQGVTGGGDGRASE
ncbi:hypothetical protein AB0I94_07830 [Streptomyces sp. NPDC050147]|uniref:hypothetical protein n=1 Tax=Streptomyces sp. NPDC050147 TaxID=3155513 RepID=UPI0034137A0F